jgi:Ca2+-binding RTX toxin-like protein
MLAITAAVIATIAVVPATAGAVSRKQRCIAELAAVGVTRAEVKDANLVVGSDGDDTFSTTSRRDLICGLGGNDLLSGEGVLERGDVFLGGEGNDVVGFASSVASSGTFYGGPGDDSAVFVEPGGNVFGAEGDDSVRTLSGVFDGGAGDDAVRDLLSGSMFLGGDGFDTVVNAGGTCIDVEVCGFQ